MDSERASLDMIRVIESPPIKGLYDERDYNKFLSENLGYISKNLKLIQTEFSCKNGRIDILGFEADVLYIIEIKTGSISTAIEQIQRYISAMKNWKYVFKENIQIKGIIIIFGGLYKTRKEYTINKTPLKSLTDNEEISRIEMNQIELLALKKVIDCVKTDIKTLERKRKKLNKQIKTLTLHREKVALDTNKILAQPLDIILDILYDKEQLVKITASNKNINKIISLLTEAKARYFVESRTGFYTEEKLNKGKKAWFYFSPKIKPSTFAKIQKLGKLRYCRTGQRKRDSNEV